MNITTWQPPNLNLLMAWTWILAGFSSGALLGLKFARNDWLGGYSSFRRRMYRLGHISFFGLGFVNLVFWLTARTLAAPPDVLLNIASLAFVTGAVAMPVCCLLMAHQPDARPHTLFAVPVASLITGATLTLWMLVKS